MPSNNPNVRRFNRGNLPFNQQVHMGNQLAPQVAPGSPAPPVVAPAGSNHADKEKIRNLEAQLASLKDELGKAPSEVVLQNLKDQAKMAEELQIKLLQRTTEFETSAQKVKDLEDQLASAPKILDTPKPLDKVWVTLIQSRTTENGNVVVACTMHTGVESEAVSGTILIPQSEVGKLRPPKQQ
jgi:hypothetical protein